MSTEEQKDSEEREGLDPEARLGSTDDAGDEGDDETRASASDDDSTSDDDTSDSDESDDDAEASAGDEDAEMSADADERAATTPSKQSAARAAAAGAAGSAGARLAAAKAAKAAKKAARKSRDAAGTGAPGGGPDPTKESVEALKESSIGQAAAKATDWAQTNRNLAAGIVGAIVLAALGWVGFAWWNASQAENAGALLADAVEIATAEIRTGAATEEQTATTTSDDEPPTFATREERSQAALEAYRRVTTEHAGTPAATWARLGEARALFDLGQMDESRAAYEQVFRDAGGDPIVAWRALEGIGFTYEVAEQWAEAIAKYEELRSIEDGAFQAPADYHIARMRIAMGETVPATTMLRELVASLQASGAGEEPEFPFVLAQAEVRLRELDPSAVSGSSPMMLGPQGGGGELPPGLEGIDPEILEQLRRQLQQQGAGAGEGE